MTTAGEHRVQLDALGGLHRRRRPAAKYRNQIEAAGLRVDTIEENPAYQFISENARGASKKFGVRSVSVLAFKP